MCLISCQTIPCHVLLFVGLSNVIVVTCHNFLGFFLFVKRNFVANLICAWTGNHLLHHHMNEEAKWYDTEGSDKQLKWVIRGISA
jgi:hypothetical protein